VKTTEIFVEQVLIGALVLIVVGLFLGVGLEDLSAGTVTGVAVGLAGLGAAYLAGIVYDRVADTMLASIESRSRLRAAKKRHDDSICKTVLPRDLFPEDKLRLLIQSAEKTVGDYADYLRTRMRLTRALATLAPALAVAVAVGKPLAGAGHSAETRVDALLWVLGMYALVFALALLREHRGDVNHRTTWRWWHYLVLGPPRTRETPACIRAYLETVLFVF